MMENLLKNQSVGDPITIRLREEIENKIIVLQCENNVSRTQVINALLYMGLATLNADPNTKRI
jgi:hypothetical protein